FDPGDGLADAAPIGHVQDFGTAAAAAPDGSVVVVGSSSNNDFLTVRYTADGRLDPTFGRGGADGDGAVTTDFWDADRPAAVAVAPDGKIVVGGGDPSILLARYNADGT